MSSLGFVKIGDLESPILKIDKISIIWNVISVVQIVQTKDFSPILFDENDKAIGKLVYSEGNVKLSRIETPIYLIRK